MVNNLKLKEIELMDKPNGKTKIGAPEKPFDWNLLDSLVFLEAELRYVAERMLIGYGQPVNETSMQAMMKRINRHLQKRFDVSYVQYKKQKEDAKKTKLRQLMWHAAEKGNPAILIFLSKQILGYSDKSEQKMEITSSDEELLSDAKKILDEVQLKEKHINE